MAYCDKCENFDSEHIDGEYDMFKNDPNYQPDLEFLDEAREYWEDHYDDVVKDIKEYANSDFKKPMGDRNVN